ncbi:MAG: hypothetical protein ABI665_00430 [Vicinamibacterales bacterium]
MVLLAATLAACADEPRTGTVTPSYDRFSARLVQLSADLNADGRIDQRTYMDGNRPLRGEADTDGDGRVDRWEYFDQQAALVRVGTSSLNDGIEDTWTWAAMTPAGERRVSLATRRDRQIDREEFFHEAVLARTEDDTNADGKTDKWDVYTNGVLREVSFDTKFTRGRADRRLIYDERGQLTGIEADDDGDGRFESLVASPEDTVNLSKRSGAKR